MRAAHPDRRAARFLGVDHDVPPGCDRSLGYWRLGLILLCAALNAAIWVAAIALEFAALDVEASGLVLTGCGMVVMTLGAFGLAVVASARDSDSELPPA